MCMHVYVNVCVHTMCTRHPRRPREDIGSTGAEVSWCGSWNQARVLWKSNKSSEPLSRCFGSSLGFLNPNQLTAEIKFVGKEGFSLQKPLSPSTHGLFSNSLPQGTEWQPSSNSSPATGYLGRFGTSDSLSLGGGHSFLSHKVQHAFHFPTSLYLSKENGKNQKKK